MFHPRACWIKMAPENMSAWKETGTMFYFNCLRPLLKNKKVQTYGDLCKDVEKEREHREINSNSLSPEPLLQIFRHGDHLSNFKNSLLCQGTMTTNTLLKNKFKCLFFFTPALMYIGTKSQPRMTTTIRAWNTQKPKTQIPSRKY